MSDRWLEFLSFDDNRAGFRSAKYGPTAYRDAQHFAKMAWDHQQAEVERLKALFKEAADYLDNGNGTSIPEGCIFHQQFREEGGK